VTALFFIAGHTEAMVFVYTQKSATLVESSGTPGKNGRTNLS
jgi:hypothetical protein